MFAPAASSAADPAADVTAEDEQDLLVAAFGASDDPAANGSDAAGTPDAALVDGDITVNVTMALVAPIVQRIADIDASWTIHPNGAVELTMDVKRDTRFPFMPRFGLRLFLPKAMSKVTYCGLGPVESYADKRRASYHGVFSGTPESMFEPYIKPQENGNHHDCDWASVETGELEPSASTVVCVDYQQSGIGSNSCGPALLERYRLDAERFTFEVAFLPQA